MRQQVESEKRGWQKMSHIEQSRSWNELSQITWWVHCRWSDASRRAMDQCCIAPFITTLACCSKTRMPIFNFMFQMV